MSVWIKSRWRSGYQRGSRYISKQTNPLDDKFEICARYRGRELAGLAPLLLEQSLFGNGRVQMGLDGARDGRRKRGE